MKKITFVAVIAMTILFAMTSIALAEVSSTTGNFTGWVAGAAPQGNTPHMGFATGTTKCAVCHSVHNAAAATPYAANAENLLRSSKAGACNYCHITDDISTREPYGEDIVANYTNDTAVNHGDSSAVIGGYNGCTSCHAVHGANTYLDADVAEYILIDGTPDAQATSDGTKAGEETLFCSQCHAYFDAGYDTAANATPQHIMTATFAATYTNGTNPALTTIATAGSVYCTSCHGSDSASTLLAAFPHYQPGYTRFLTDGTGAGLGSTEADAAKDGACLKCHGTAMVGVAY